MLSKKEGDILENTRKLDKQNVEDIIGLSPLQEGILFHHVSEPGTYVEQLSFRLTGFTSSEAVRQAWDVLGEEIQSLRTVFRWEKVDKPVQIFLRRKVIPMTEHDLVSLHQVEQDVRLKEIREAERDRGIALESDPFRLTICKLSQTELEMVLTYHHILFDGWSTGLLLQKFIDVYRTIEEGKPRELIHQPSYKEFIRWHQKQDRKAQHEYWKQVLAGFDNRTRLPGIKATDVRNREMNADHDEIGAITYQLTEEQSAKLQFCANDHQVTLATLVYTAWGLILGRWNNADDVVFGTTVSGRKANIKGIDQMIGLFINTLPLRVSTNGQERVSELLRRMDYSLNEREDFESAPLYEISGLSEIDKRETLFDSLVVMENYPLDERLNRSGDGKKLELTSLSKKMNYPLTLGVYPFQGLKLEINYQTALFAPEVITRFADQFVQMLLALTEAGDRLVAQLDPLLPKERAALLGPWSGTELPYQQNVTVDQLFAAQVERTPNHLAVVMGDVQLTYQELHEKSNRLARTLHQHGIQRGATVVLLMEKSVELIVGLLAILKAGGAYLPIDPALPDERIQYMSDDSAAVMVLTVSQHKERAPIRLPILDLKDPTVFAEDSCDLPVVTEPKDVAVIYYTSGSTGLPKGVEIEHHGIVNQKAYVEHVLGIGTEDRIGQFASFAFNATIWEVFMALLNGAQLHLLGPNLIQDPAELTNYFETQGITTVTMAPTYLSQLDPLRFPKLKRLITAGSESSPKLVRSWGDRIFYLNAYGSTETTNSALVWHYIPGEPIPEPVPIGKPFPNKRVYLLDNYLRLQPIGAVGEICVGGAGTARGYVNKPELTAERFVPNPYVPGERLYRTGDIGRWREDGTVEFIGRLDRQVKVRGFRIEIGEVEATIRQHPNIAQTVVAPVEDGRGDRALCAYVVWGESEEKGIAELKEFLISRMPAYMIPAYWVELQELPLTPSRKIDMKQLPDPRTLLESHGERVLPKNEWEEIIAACWREVLRLESVSVQDSFFDLGGNSIMIMHLHGKFEKRFPNLFEIPDLFSNPTVQQQAAFLERKLTCQEERTVLEIALPHGLQADRVLAAGYEWKFEEELYQSLQEIAVHEGVTIEAVLVGLWLYHLGDRTGQQELKVDTLLVPFNEVRPLFLPVNQYTEFGELFRAAESGARSDASTSYSMGQLKRARAGLLPLIYKKECLTLTIDLFDNYDLVIELSGDHMSLESKTDLVREEILEAWVQGYLEVLRLVVSHYAARIG